LVTAGCSLHGRHAVSASKQSPISEQSVRAHMEFLAGDALNGRGSGTRDEWIAASYVAAQMRRLGLDPLGDDGGYVQKVTIQRVEVTSGPVLTIGSRRFTHGKEIVVNPGAARVVGKLQEWRAGAAVPAGAAIVLPDPPPADFTPPDGAIVLSPRPAAIKDRWSTFLTRTARVPPQVGDGTQARPSMVFLDPDAYAVARSAAPGETITIQVATKPAAESHTWNAVGRLQGESAKGVILLSAHIDHLGNRNDPPAAGGDQIFNGADDDASGAVAVLELMEALANGRRPRHSIVFALFGSEESGGNGSEFFAAKPAVPLADIRANLQFEMIGRPDAKVAAHTLWLTGYERSTLGPELARRGAKLVQDPHPEQNFFERSDNIQFARRGVVAHTVSSYGLHADYHTPDDEIDRIDFAHMTTAIRSLLGPIRWLADSEFVPTWVPGKKP
jgi:hypothetical protein